MKKIYLLLVVVILVAVSSGAACAADRTGQAKDLMSVLGFDAMLESVRRDAGKMVEEQIDGVSAQLQRTNPGMPDATRQEFRAAAQKMGRRVSGSWSPAEAAKIYAGTLIDGLPEADMRAAIEHYKTPEGQRELRVINDAVGKTNSYIMQSIQTETDLAMKDFLREIKELGERDRNR